MKESTIKETLNKENCTTHQNEKVIACMLFILTNFIRLYGLRRSYLFRMCFK